MSPTPGRGYTPQRSAQRAPEDMTRQLAEKGKRPGEVLFTAHEARWSTLSDLIKQCADEHAWSSQLRWSPHSLRYGALAILKKCGGNTQLAEAATTMSGQILRHYTRPNEERLALLQQNKYDLLCDSEDED